MLKKYIVSIFLLLSVPTLIAYAAPSFMVSGSGSNVSVSVTNAEHVAPVVFYYTSTSGGVQSSVIGTTDSNGSFSGMVSGDNFPINTGYYVYVMVNGQQSPSVIWPSNNGTNNGGLTLSPSVLTIMVGQSVTVSISGASGSYYVSSNSDRSKVIASVSGSVLSLQGSQSGTSLISVCASVGTCGSVRVTVGGQNTNTSSPIANQSVVTISQGQTGTIIFSGGMTPYTVTNVSGGGASPSLIGNVLTLTGSLVGTNVLNVCSANGGGCTEISVNVINQSTQTNPALSFTIDVLNGRQTKIALGGGNGSYFLQSQASMPVSASISNNILTLTGASYGSGSIIVCSTGTACITLYVSVTQAKVTLPPLTGTGGGYFFEADLSVGMTGQDVSELQSRLKSEGYFSGTPTGYFGSITEAAVSAYQSAHGISSIGIAGPQTRASLNK